MLFKKKKDDNKQNIVDNNVQNPQNSVVSASDALPKDPVNYNNIMPGAVGSSQPNTSLNATTIPNEVSDKSLATEHREKIKRPLIDFRYTVINDNGKKEQGTFEAESENDVRNFLLSLNYQVLSIKQRDKFDIDIGANHNIGAGDLSFSLTQLSTYIKSGIPLADSVKILAKQTKKPNLKKSFNQLVYQLLKGESLSDAMLMQDKVYPKLLINMVKTAEMTGDLPSILDDMSEYYTSMDQTRKQMKSAMTYPVVVLTIAIGVLVFMLTYLVPQFSSMFKENGAEMPALTMAILNVSGFLTNYWYYVLLVIFVVVFIFMQLYKKVQKFRETVQIILMHIPVAKDIIIYNEIANFTKTFASLLNHGVFITDSMEILSKITNNEVYKKIINQTLENLGKGDSISSAFKGQWAIPVVAYEMIVTGETTGQLGQMMEKVADHFQMLHKNVIDQMKSLVEPILICFLAVVVGIILVSIIQPMFSIYSQIK
ncbi:MAG: type II secretion system F family protein [Bacilli bacterium]|nr:type II secretion system F family protein [Bacilli bacterium]